MSWVSTFEAAKRDVFLQQNFPQRPEPEEPYSPMVPDNSSPSFSFSGEDLLASARSKPGEDSNATETSRPSGSLGSWAASVPGVSLLLASYAGNNTTSSTTTSDPSVATNEAGENESGSSNQRTNQDTESQRQSALPEDSSPASTQQARDEPSPPPSLDAATLTHSRSMPIFESASESTEHTRQQSEIEKLMTSSLHLVPKATPLATTEYVHVVSGDNIISLKASILTASVALLFIASLTTQWSWSSATGSFTFASMEQRSTPKSTCSTHGQADTWMIHGLTSRSWCMVGFS